MGSTLEMEQDHFQQPFRAGTRDTTQPFSRHVYQEHRAYRQISHPKSPSNFAHGSISDETFQRSLAGLAHHLLVTKTKLALFGGGTTPAEKKVSFDCVGLEELSYCTVSVELAQQLVLAQEELRIFATRPRREESLRLRPHGSASTSSAASSVQFRRNTSGPPVSSGQESNHSGRYPSAARTGPTIHISSTQRHMLDQFLEAVRGPVRQKDAEQLRNILLVEPPLPPIYDEVVKVLRAKYPKGNDAELAKLCEDLAPPHPEGGSSWSAFGEVVRRYLIFLRDFDPNHYLNIYNTLYALLNQCNIALSDSTYGVVILPTVLYLTKVLAKFAVALDKNPEVVASQQRGQQADVGDSGLEKVGYVEKSANVVRDAFIKCLADKSGSAGLAGPGRRGKPENKRIGIYQTANFCLKLLFQCRKLRNAEQMFVSIDNQSPPLSYYPASQQVTYLYYLGRYHFANNHFYRALLALQAAYDKCHRDALKQKRLILIYLITSNIILGRFPSPTLLSRPEASGLDRYFSPLCRIISQGDIVGFRNYLDLDSPVAEWFLKFRILLQLRNRCEVLVWRSLVRRVFVAVGYKAEDGKGMPFLRLSQLQAAIHLLDRQHQNHRNQHSPPPSSSSSSSIDPDFASIPESCALKSFDLESGYYLPDQPPSSISTTLLLPPPAPSPTITTTTIPELESLLTSLIQQSLLHGFITHDNPRFAIPGAKQRGGALRTGFPRVWHVIVRDRIESHHPVPVPGWVRDPLPSSSSTSSSMNGSGNTSGRLGAAAGTGASTGGGGRVINLSGARPVGSAGAVGGGF